MSNLKKKKFIKIYSSIFFNFSKGKNYKIKLSGWLKTPADWARFNAWAKIKARPRKIPEPPEVVSFYHWSDAPKSLINFLFLL